ncbi:hypothetical protein [Pseudoalteromonas sp. DY56-GL79]|uniref:hypothetical protein n=1 Tax=Pseudoalteromonas sp. DY56-GL79 TaxID=2967131 RepID=UPI00352AC9C5
MKYFIPSDTFHYTRALLFSWACNTAPTNLSETNGVFFSTKLKEYVGSLPKAKIIVNCNNVVDVDDHFLDPLEKVIKEKKVSVLFYSNDNKNKLTNYIRKNFTETSTCQMRKTEISSLVAIEITHNGKWLDDLESVILNVNKREKESLIDVVSDCFYKNECDEVLSSTPLVATGRFNAMDIISDPYKFRWFILNLVESINNIVSKDEPKSYTLVAASLRGSVIAGSVHELLLYISGSDLYLIDHIGPKHHIYEMTNSHKFEESDYCIYIGDFLIAGTELKVTQAYCQFTGGNIKHSFVIGKYTEIENLNNQIMLHSLVSLRDCVDELTYTLK